MSKPNIVMILADDLREQDLQYIDSISLLAPKMARFPFAITTFPLCAPSRAMLLTGYNQARTGIRVNDAGLFDPGWPTLGTRLKAAGYTTGLVGKVLNKMANLPDELPGWDTWQILPKMNTYGRDQTNILTNQAVQFMQDAKSPGPMFLYLAPVSPHGPLMGPPECDPNTGLTYGGITRAGHAFPRCPFEGDEHEWKRRMSSLCGLDHLVDKVTRRMPTSNTYFIFVGDNGYMFENGRLGKSETVWDALHVPMMMMGPGIVPGERREIVTLYDLHATILEMAGVSVSPGDIDGTSFLPIAKGNSIPWNTTLTIESAPADDDDNE